MPWRNAPEFFFPRYGATHGHAQEPTPGSTVEFWGGKCAHRGQTLPVPGHGKGGWVWEGPTMGWVFKLDFPSAKFRVKVFFGWPGLRDERSPLKNKAWCTHGARTVQIPPGAKNPLCSFDGVHHVQPRVQVGKDRCAAGTCSSAVGLWCFHCCFRSALTVS